MMRPDAIGEEFSPEVAAAAGPRWTDISMPLRNGMHHLHGDPEVEFTKIRSIEGGDQLDLTMLRLGAHAGTHVDAPRHFIPGGKTVDMAPMSTLMGPARVIEIRDPQSIKASELTLHHLGRGERVLFKTRNSARSSDQDAGAGDFVHLTLGGASYLMEKRIRLVGIDYLAIGPLDNDGVLLHRVLLGAGIWIVEGLDLSRVAPGKYEMICLPLRLEGCEAAPARAILRPAS